MNNYSILIDCPDCYLDILRVFFVFLSKNWKNRKSHIYISTQESDIEHPDNISFIKCGKNKSCIERSLVAMDYIQEKYIITVDCDDFIFKEVDDSIFDELVKFMHINKAKCIQIWKLKNKEHRKYKTDFPGLYKCNKKARYSRSLMANIWEKEAYRSLFKNAKTDGWKVEGMWLKECYESEPGYIDDFFYYDLDPLNILHSVSKGCWIRNSYRKIIKHGIPKEMLSQRKKLGIGLSIKFTISMFLLNHLSSKSFLKLKKLFGRNKNYATDY